MAEPARTDPLTVPALASALGELAGVKRRSLLVVAVAVAAALLLLVAKLVIGPIAGAGSAHLGGAAPASRAAALADAGNAPGGVVPAVEPQAFEQLSTEEAEARNAARPLSTRPLEPARPFVFPATPTNTLEWNRAVNCLALANYYEAASEGPAGMRAVSQVVLNRVRHPAFPKSVCEVVFQGSERPTGCQFTFTCDGSLSRPPVAALFARARTIAMAALRGTVERGVGMATHYHTRQVVPYWADSLDKIRVLGAHIFYVWHGGAGSRAAFQGQYAGEGSAVADAYLPADQQIAPAASEPALARQEFQQSARQMAAAAGGSSAKRTYLVADEQPKGLLADDTGAGKLQARPLLSLSADRPLADGR